MKNSIIMLIVAAITISSCNKNSNERTASPEPVKPLSAEFKISSNDISEKQSLTLTASDDRSTNSYFWDFGLIDGARITSTQKMPAISYRIHGDYSITLTVTNPKGESVTSTQNFPVVCTWSGGSSAHF